jgi:hypothetical protein
MKVPVDLWLRGEHHATTDTIEVATPDPELWTDDDLHQLLGAMLRALHRQKHPGHADQPVTLRGLSWIVNPFEAGGVVIAIEITLGAAVAGPFAIGQADLERQMSRVLAHQPLAGGSSRVH